MIIRQIKEGQWERVYSQIIAYGRAAPLSLQYDVEINCNGAGYILKVQPAGNRKIAALQAVSAYPNGDETCYALIKDNEMLSALLEIITYQWAGSADKAPNQTARPDTDTIPR